jgi:cytochrome c553
MTINRIKFLVIAIFALPLLAMAVFNTNTIRVTSAQTDAATTYKTKCAACHSPKAEKFYNSETPEAQQIETIMKGKKGEKPPYMPGFEAKGMTADEAIALAGYRKQLKTPAN